MQCAVVHCTVHFTVQFVHLQYLCVFENNKVHFSRSTFQPAAPFCKLVLHPSTIIISEEHSTSSAIVVPTSDYRDTLVNTMGQCTSSTGSTERTSRQTDVIVAERREVEELCKKQEQQLVHSATTKKRRKVNL